MLLIKDFDTPIKKVRAGVNNFHIDHVRHLRNATLIRLMIRFKNNKAIDCKSDNIHVYSFHKGVPILFSNTDAILSPFCHIITSIRNFNKLHAYHAYICQEYLEIQACIIFWNFIVLSGYFAGIILAKRTVCRTFRQLDYVDLAGIRIVGVE